MSPEIGKEVPQLSQSLHIAIFNGIADDRNLNDVGVEVNPVFSFHAFFDEFRRIWDDIFISSFSLSFGSDYNYDGMFAGARINQY